MPVIASDERLARWAARERDPRRPGWRRRLPRWTVRLRLTMLYGVLFLVAGAALLGITYALVAGDSALSANRQFVLTGDVARAASALPNGPTVRFSNPSRSVQALRLPAGLPRELRPTAKRLQHAANVQIAQARSAQLSALLTKSGIALGIMALVSIALGWLMAGRALRPLQAINARMRQISEHNLHERLALVGHDDEFKELGTTFDGLLERLEGAFESQRRFVANASHELRTPVTLERALLEVALADPDADVASLRAACERVLAAGEQQERTIGALLTLARSQRGLDARHELDLGEVAAEVLAGADASGVTVESELEPAPASGDRALIERLVANLVENAIRHNDERGWVRLSTAELGDRAVLRVLNTGPRISLDQIDAIHEPFRRLNGDRTGHGAGAGLGLSIVDAIARAHGAVVRTEPRRDGGLEVEVVFPPVAAARPAPALH